MCGIAGIVNRHGTELDDFYIKKCTDAIEHRGPDANGHFVNDDVLFVHTRLSILDLSSKAAQPMSDASERYVITYNGEVYNYRELAEDLGLSNLRSTSDTEVIVEGFAKVGTDLFSKLNGMFALAIYDKQERKVWLARDRLGIKPLYYKLSSDALSFGSEMKVIQCFMDDALDDFNKQSVHEWVYFGNTLGEETLYEGVKRLMPGSFIEFEVDSSQVSVSQYWKPHKPVVGTVKEGCIVAKNRELLENAVKRQLVSDVPIGIFLSGGVDSSAVTAFASKHYEKKLSTYSVGFDFDKGINELPRARSVATHFGTEHHEIHISGVDVADVVEKMIYHHDHPFCDAANIPLFLLCEEVKGKTKVVLQGDGGDELYGGYKRYNTLMNIKKMRFISRIANVANKFLPKNKKHQQRQRYINALLSSPEHELMALLLTVEDKKHSPIDVFSKAFRDEFLCFDPFSRYKKCQSEVANLDITDQMLIVDSQIILPDIFLEKVDRATMASSVEVRVPFLDNDLIKFVQELPSVHKIPNGKQKWLLKKSLEGIVPNDVLYGPKTGFGVPFAYWVEGALRDLLFDNLKRFNDRNPDVIDLKAIADKFNQHKAQQKDYGFLLWKVLNFTLWANQRSIKIQ
ncbi:asparagine synthase (glutamine-hydrolyzing) [Pleionea sp. CnH1-48]|uniref:asparagine synthase (glutamine-hydrolyzing) n=1 Tax=Pleionea sp. CnH1-48 TaxID=2954494 RepID=UPI0020985D64|nr:asparagine synthase (glutamine-hydrolyzing) [Pleionea sp. CnH1-48]MCO7223791.1 asparagine synthase (glutamine-hydrolyzing) [Pleionea sp. CnH1-48]